MAGQANAAAGGAELRERRRAKPVRDDGAQAGKAAALGQEEGGEELEVMQWSWSARARQHVGLVLGVAACASTVAAAGDGTAASGTWKMMLCLLLACVALVLHETRPYHGAGLGDLFQHNQDVADAAAAVATAAVGGGAESGAGVGATGGGPPAARRRKEE